MQNIRPCLLALAAMCLGACSLGFPVRPLSAFGAALRKDDGEKKDGGVRVPRRHKKMIPAIGVEGKMLAELARGEPGVVVEMLGLSYERPLCGGSSRWAYGRAVGLLGLGGEFGAELGFGVSSRLTSRLLVLHAGVSASALRLPDRLLVPVAAEAGARLAVWKFGVGFSGSVGRDILATANAVGGTVFLRYEIR